MKMNEEYRKKKMWNERRQRTVNENVEKMHLLFDFLKNISFDVSLCGLQKITPVRTCALSLYHKRPWKKKKVVTKRLETLQSPSEILFDLHESEVEKNESCSVISIRGSLELMR